MENNTVQIDLQQNAVYVVKDGKIETVEAPPSGFGKQTVCWQNGKPSHVDINFTKKLG